MEVDLYTKRKTSTMNSLSTLAFVLLNLGCLVALAGFCFRTELIMRLILAVGSLIFLLGYLDASTELDLIGTSWAALFTLVNLAFFIKLSVAKSTFKFLPREKYLHNVFKGMEADDFKKLLAITTWHEAPDHMKLTVENEVCPDLFYILTGKVEVSKDDSMFTLNPNTFIGEVGYFLRSGASATTIVEKGAMYVSWNTRELRELEENTPGVRATIYGMLNKDMAMKVAASLR